MNILRQRFIQSVVPLPESQTEGTAYLATYNKYAHFGLLGYCLVASLSIVLSQILLVSVIAYWLFTLCYNCFVIECETTKKALEKTFNATTSSFAMAALAWLSLSLMSAVFGIAPLFSLEEIAKTAVYLLAPFCVAFTLVSSSPTNEERLSRTYLYLSALVASQCLAAIHTIASAAIGMEIPPKIPGGLTESGQAVLTLPTLAFLLFLNNGNNNGNLNCEGASSNNEDSGTKDGTVKKCSFLPRAWFSSLLYACCLLGAAWPQIFAADEAAEMPVQLAALGLAALAFIFNGSRAKKLQAAIGKGTSWWNSRISVHYYSFAWALVCVALLVNLKRGPWMGTLCALICLGLLASRRLLYISIITVGLCVLVLSPARMRVLRFAEHFAIDGGRQQMWALGAEIVQRYPLGLGPDNSKYIQTLNPELPDSHEHMHNNLLNVTVESGWTGLLAYTWWMYLCVALGISAWLARKKAKDKDINQSRAALLALALSSALLGWQVAGFVEYNFGDGEVRMIAFFFMGLLLALLEPPRTKSVSK